MPRRKTIFDLLRAHCQLKKGVLPEEETRVLLRTASLLGWKDEWQRVIDGNGPGAGAI
jgi:hypothetical protein